MRTATHVLRRFTNKSSLASQCYKQTRNYSSIIDSATSSSTSAAMVSHGLGVPNAVERGREGWSRCVYRPSGDNSTEENQEDMDSAREESKKEYQKQIDMRNEELTQLNKENGQTDKLIPRVVIRECKQ